MVDFTTTYTTTTTFMRFALDNDALRRVVAVAIRRGRRVRRGYKKEQRSCEKTWYYYSLLAATGGIKIRFHRFIVSSVQSVFNPAALV